MNRLNNRARNILFLILSFFFFLRTILLLSTEFLIDHFEINTGPSSIYALNRSVFRWYRYDIREPFLEICRLLFHIFNGRI